MLRSIIIVKSHLEIANSPLFFAVFKVFFALKIPFVLKTALKSPAFCCWIMGSSNARLRLTLDPCHSHVATELHSSTNQEVVLIAAAFARQLKMQKGSREVECEMEKRGLGVPQTEKRKKKHFPLASFFTLLSESEK